MVHTPYSSPDSPAGVHPGECCPCVLSACRAQVGLSGEFHPNEGHAHGKMRASQNSLGSGQWVM